MVPSPQEIPNHNEPIKRSNIKPKIFSTSEIGGGGLFQKYTPCTPRHQVINTQETWAKKLWDPHGVEGWYLVPDMEQNRCYIAYVNKNRAGRIADIV